MPTAVQNRTFSNNACVIYPEKAELVSVRLPGGVNYPQNTILGELNTVKANEVQLITGTTAVGTFTLTMDSVVSAALTCASLTAAAVQAAMDSIIGTKNCVVTGSLNGAGTGVITITYAGEYANADISLVTLTTSITGTLVASESVKGASGQGMNCKVYLLGATDGSQLAKFILKDAVQTDAKGALLNEFGVATQAFTTPAYAAGHFLASEIPGLTVANLAQMGRLYSGNAITDQGAIVKLGI